MSKRTAMIQQIELFVPDQGPERPTIASVYKQIQGEVRDLEPGQSTTITWIVSLARKIQQ
ncbi:MAG: hypothetical protein HC875_37860 [Anaerolineales bacterium]|nr:hypothetical protein [Anaerolineales bacterium]